MKNLSILIVCFVISIALISGCTTREVQKTDSVTTVQQPASGTNPAPLPDTSEPDWAKKTIQVIGKCAVNPAHAGNPGQARLMAERGAEVDGQRKIAEQVLGVRLSSKTLVRDMVAQHDEVRTAVDALVREARIIGTNFDGQIATVNMELKMYNVYTYFKEKKVYYE